MYVSSRWPSHTITFSDTTELLMQGAEWRRPCESHLWIDEVYLWTVRSQLLKLMRRQVRPRLVHSKRFCIELCFDAERFAHSLVTHTATRLPEFAAQPP